jgi:tetratricopeptide (TPR) repeat protein
MVQHPAMMKPYINRCDHSVSGTIKKMVYAAILIATLCAYLPLGKSGFVNYDDVTYVTDNPVVQGGLTLKNVLWAMTATDASNWHPLTWISHMADVQMFGMHAGGHHLTNVLLHMLNAILLLVWLHTITGEFWKSSVVAALFALHPLHVESVAWIAERKDVLSTVFWFLTLLCYTLYCQKNSRRQYLLALFFFICGLMAKPMLVTLPCVLLLLDFWPLKRFSLPSATERKENFEQNSSPNKTEIWRLLAEKIPFGMLSLLSCGATLIAQRNAMASINDLSLFPRTVNAVVSYTEYLAKTFFPWPLAVLYPHPLSFPLWKVLASVFVLVSISVMAVRKVKSSPWLAVGWFWFIGTLIPVIGLVQVGILAYADRYTYIPLTGIFIMVVWQIPETIQSWKYKNIILSVSAIAVLSMLWGLTWLQVQYWKNSVTLFEHDLKVTAGNYVAHNNLGLALDERGDTQDAIRHYQEAIRIYPDFAYAYISSGISAYHHGKIQDAISYYQKGLSLDPTLSRAHFELGNIYFLTHQTGSAIVQYAKAIQLRPKYVEAVTNLAIALLVTGKKKESLELFNEALRINPDFAKAKDYRARFFPQKK